MNTVYLILYIGMTDKRSYRDRAEYLKQAVQKRRKKIREMAVKYKGGECELCGYCRCINVLEFHHKDPDKKDFGISASGHSRAWLRVKTELDKCVILCANCHREIHAGITQLPAETPVENEVNCRET